MAVWACGCTSLGTPRYACLKLVEFSEDSPLSLRGVDALIVVSVGVSGVFPPGLIIEVLGRFTDIGEL